MGDGDDPGAVGARAGGGYGRVPRREGEQVS